MDLRRGASAPHSFSPHSHLTLPSRTPHSRTPHHPYPLNAINTLTPSLPSLPPLPSLSFSAVTLHGRCRMLSRRKKDGGGTERKKDAEPEAKPQAEA